MDINHLVTVMEFDEADRGRLKSTNYWQTPLACQGGFLLSQNHKAFQLLVPAALVREFRRELRGTREVIVSRGPWPQAGVSDAIELLFEDGSQSPFSVALQLEQCTAVPPASDSGRSDLRCIVYGPGLIALGEFAAKFRVAKRLPCLAPWIQVGR